MLFGNAKEPTEERGTAKEKKGKVILTHMLSIPAHTLSMNIYRVHACQHSPLEAIISTSSNVDHSSARLYPIGKWNKRACSQWIKNIQPEPFCSYTYMYFSSCRFISSRGRAASAYIASISDVSTTGGCAMTAG